MKKDIHPTYYKKAKIVCSCGQQLKVGSTKAEARVEICSHCHPFYTGKTKVIDTAGKVERFQARAAKTKILQAQRLKKKTSKKRV
jgi:large subunit ribosomal protein L31